MKRCAAIVMIGFCVGPASPGSIATAQQPAAAPSEPLDVDVALSQRTLGSAPTSMCASDSFVAYTVRSAERIQEERSAGSYHTVSGVPLSAVGAEQWVISTRTGIAQDVSGPRGVSWSGTWSPDCRTLAFFSNRDGAVRLWLWMVADGRVRRLSPVKLRPLQVYDVPQWTPDGRHIVIKLVPEATSPDSAPAPERSTAGVTLQGNVGRGIFVYRVAPSDSVTAAGVAAGLGVPYLSDLGVITVADGTVRRVARNLPIASYAVSPTRNAVLYTVNRGFASIGTQDNQVEIRVQSLDGGASRVLVPRVFMSLVGRGVSWSPDGSRIAYCIGTFSESVRHDCYVVGLDGGTPRLATRGDHPQFMTHAFPPLWDPQGQHLYLVAADTLWRVDVAAGAVKAVATVPGRRLRLIVASPYASSFWSPNDGASLYVHTHDPVTEQTGYAEIDLRRGSAQLVFEESTAGLEAFRDAGGLEAAGRAVVYAVEGAATPPDLWLATDGFRKRRRMTNINPRLNGIAFGRSRLVTWLGLDGQALQGALLTPPNYVSGRRYPLVVWVYGTARRSETVHKFGLAPLELNLQLLATRGYIVLAPDAPMSGEAPMLEIAKTVIPGVNRLVELGIADPARLGVGGMSYGGYSTMALITQTRRFGAAVVIAGLSNLMTDYGAMDSTGFGATLGIIEQGIGQMRGTPWDRRSRYIENSPYFYLDRVNTPVLLLHGTVDPVTSAFGADQTFTALRRLGKPVEYVKYEGVGHAFNTTPPAQQRDYLTRIIEWFDTHLAAPRGDSVGLPAAGGVGGPAPSAEPN